MAAERTWVRSPPHELSIDHAIESHIETEEEEAERLIRDHVLRTQEDRVRQLVRAVRYSPPRRSSPSRDAERALRDAARAKKEALIRQADLLIHVDTVERQHREKLDRILTAGTEERREAARKEFMRTIAAQEAARERARIMAQESYVENVRLAEEARDRAEVAEREALDLRVDHKNLLEAARLSTRRFEQITTRTEAL
jgi:hypothetical protein